MSVLNKVFVAVAASVLALSVTGCATTRHASANQYVDSAAITTRVKTALAADRSVRGMPISVKTERNVVLLSGSVNTKYQATRAVEIARGVPGVADVRSSLVVRGRHHHHHHYVVSSTAPVTTSEAATPAPVATSEAETPAAPVTTSEAETPAAPAMSTSAATPTQE